ncbi:MAG: hypothetical protein ACTTGJ_03030 [Clostridium sp.]
MTLKEKINCIISKIDMEKNKKVLTYILNLSKMDMIKNISIVYIHDKMYVAVNRKIFCIES